MLLKSCGRKLMSYLGYGRVDMPYVTKLEIKLAERAGYKHTRSTQNGDSFKLNPKGIACLCEARLGHISQRLGRRLSCSMADSGYN